jgi:hypothetical protein
MLRELDKESILLLYLADELSATDRAEVERMLSADAGLQSELERLSAAQSSFESAMATLDARPLASESVVTRRIGAAMRQKLAEQVAKPQPAAPAPQRRTRYPWWAYPTASAAAVLIAMVSYWGHQPDGKSNLPAHTDQGPMVQIPGDTANRTLATAADDKQVEDLNLNFENDNASQPKPSVASLDSAEHHLAELSHSVFGLNDGNE